jgi:tetratricopeptide (TPR) repeat protein
MDTRAMTPTLDVAAPAETAPAPAPVSPRPGRRPRLRFWKLLWLTVVASLAVFNGWWYWRDHRPLPDRTTLSARLSQGKYHEVERALREYLRRSPRDGEARMMLARSLAGRKDFVACARTLHEVPSWWPTKVEALLREGQAYLQIDRAKDAETAWLQAAQDDPLHPVSSALYHDVCQELLTLYAIEDRWEDAFPVMWMAYEHAQPVDHAVLLMMRLRSEIERVAPKETVVHLRKYVAADPTDWEARRALARAELQLGRSDQAAHQFEACLTGRRDDVRAWRDYLAMLHDQGDLDAFLTLLAKPPPSADAEPETWQYRAVAHERAGDWKAASDDYEKAIELNPFVPKYHYRLAMAQERLGLRNQAKIHRERNKEMNEARAQLRTAYFDYFSARDDQGPGAPDMAAVCRRLATICETLGWSRASQAWNRVARQP